MEDFVTFEIAKKLKEKGFRELCLAYYTNDDRLWLNCSHKAGATYSDCYISHNLMPKGSVSSKFVDAPTISQVLKWFREEKLILIGLSPMQEYGGDEIVEWCATVYKADKQGGLSRKEEFYNQSYEQAATNGIEYVLNNLI